MLLFPGFGGPDRSFRPDVRRDIRPKTSSTRSGGFSPGQAEKSSTSKPKQTVVHNAPLNATKQRNLAPESPKQSVLQNAPSKMPYPLTLNYYEYNHSMTVFFRNNFGGSCALKISGKGRLFRRITRENL